MWGRLETSRDVQNCQDQQNSFLLSTSMACAEPRVCGWRKEDKIQNQASTRLYSRASYGWPWELQIRSGENCLGPSLYLLHWIDFLPRHESRFSVRPLSHQQWSLVVLEIRILLNISMSRSWEKVESSNSKAVGLILARILRLLYPICLVVIESPKQLSQLGCFLMVKAVFLQALPSSLREVRTETLGLSL